MAAAQIVEEATSCCTEGASSCKEELGPDALTDRRGSGTDIIELYLMERGKGNLIVYKQVIVFEQALMSCNDNQSRACKRQWGDGLGGS